MEPIDDTEGKLLPLMRRYELCAHALEMAAAHEAECRKQFDEVLQALEGARSALHMHYRAEAQSVTAAAVVEA